MQYYYMYVNSCNYFNEKKNQYYLELHQRMIEFITVIVAPKSDFN